MPTFDYRIVRRDYADKTGNFLDTQYFIVEAYYDENDKVFMITQTPEGPFGSTVEELRRNWFEIAEAFTKPILNWDNIPEEGAVNILEERMSELMDENGNLRPTEELEKEGKLIPSNEVFKNLQNKFIGSEFVPELDDFDMKEYFNERVVERNKSEQEHNNNYIGHSIYEVALRIVQSEIEKNGEE